VGLNLLLILSEYAEEICGLFLIFRNKDATYLGNRAIEQIIFNHAGKFSTYFGIIEVRHFSQNFAASFPTFRAKFSTPYHLSNRMKTMAAPESKDRVNNGEIQ